MVCGESQKEWNQQLPFKAEAKKKKRNNRKKQQQQQFNHSTIQYTKALFLAFNQTYILQLKIK